MSPCGSRTQSHSQGTIWKGGPFCGTCNGKAIPTRTISCGRASVARFCPPISWILRDFRPLSISTARFHRASATFSITCGTLPRCAKRHSVTVFWLITPKFFFVEAFHAGLSKDLQSRMPEDNEGTTLAAYTLTAIRIGRPLERPGWKPPAPSGGGSRWPRRSGASSTVAALSPPPEAATDEAKLAAWERSNLNGQDRRDARIKRGACTFCGVSGHKATHCPVKPARVNALAYDDDVATLHVDTENELGAAQ